MKCDRCKNEAAKGRRKCPAHLKQATEEQARRREKLIEKGLCDRCGKNSPQEGCARCSVCLSEQSQDARAFQADRVKRRICVGCGGSSQSGTKYYCRPCAEKRNQDSIVQHAKIKQEVFEYYGGAFCACCGEKEFTFLTMDHINNDGARQRREDTKTYNLIRWLKANNFPPGFQVLCMNCNFGKQINGGICPHQQVKEKGEQQ